MYLRILSGEFQGKQFPLKEGENTIGRWDPALSAFPDIDLDEFDAEAKISRVHAKITLQQSVLFISDLGSRNGTYVNKRHRVSEGQTMRVRPGDSIVIGSLELCILDEI